jgi:hypothetical protein
MFRQTSHQHTYPRFAEKGNAFGGGGTAHITGRKKMLGNKEITLH